MGRLRTGKGDIVGWRELPHILISFYQSILRKLFGRIPRVPWIPFTAAKHLDRLISGDWVVLEIGSGHSTLWLAERAGQVISLEAAEEWFNRLKEIIESEGITNIDLRYEWHVDRMSDFTFLDDESLDLLFVDGGPRRACLEQGFSKVKKGGYLYLDNWDNDLFWGSAREFFCDRAAEIQSIQSLIDYVPAQVGVYQGLIVQRK